MAYAVATHAFPASTKPETLWSMLLDMISVSRQRRQLGKLDQRLLEDIGVSAGSAQRETGCAFWDVHDTWRAH